MRLIDADEAIRISKNDKYMWVYDLTDLEEFLAGVPTISPDSLVKRGRWLGTHDGVYYSYSCSECDAEALTEEETMHDQVLSKYCPNCGALMED